MCCTRDEMGMTRSTMTYDYKSKNPTPATFFTQHGFLQFTADVSHALAKSILISLCCYKC